MAIFIEALELIIVIPLSISNRKLFVGDVLDLSIDLFDGSKSINLSVDIDKDTLVQGDILIIYNGQHPNDILKAKAALLGYENCSGHIVDNIPIIVCINRMF